VHANTSSAIAKEALARIAALFQIEAGINGHGPEHRHAVRQEQALPRLAALKDFFDSALASLSRKSGLAAAIRYSLSRWQALCRFAHDGRLEMTNNAAERAIRPLALAQFLIAGHSACNAASEATSTRACAASRIGTHAARSSIHAGSSGQRSEPASSRRQRTTTSAAFSITS
jgi:hypothetical protein